MQNALYKRRSIRKYSEREVSEYLIRQLIHAATQAPSSKNRQPWRFVVVRSSSAKSEMIAAMKSGLEREASSPSLPQSQHYLGGAVHTLKIMEAAPVTIFVINPSCRWNTLPTGMEEQFYRLADTQSIGAAIQNMLVTATALELGTLWNCDIFFAYEEICQWLETDEQVVAAISVGFPAEDPMPRPRKSVDDVTEWL